MPTNWNLPELGDNIETATILRVLIKAGDAVRKEQAVLEVETDKGNLEVPSSVSGTIAQVLVKVGDKIAPGAVVFAYDSPQSPVAGRQGPVTATSVHLPDTAVTGDRRPATGGAVVVAGDRRPATGDALAVPRAAPFVRRLARDLGIALENVPASGPDGQILLEDVTEFARALISSHVSRRASREEQKISAPPLPDFSRFGAIATEPMSQIRSVTAQRMAHSWNTIPHVTHFDTADITVLDGLRQQWAPKLQGTGGKLTMTAMLLKACAHALHKYPQFAASLDVAHEAIILKKYVHVGVAVDTPQGLVVPVVRNVDQKSLRELAIELQTLAVKAREKKLTLDDVQGACFTITNLGGIGGTNFTPIINSPEVAILAASRSMLTPVWIDKSCEPRLILPLGLSYDHRLLDGAAAARFMRTIVDQLENAELWKLEG